MGSSEPIKPLVVDLSHWDPAQDYEQVADAGIIGVIYKSTEGSGYTDPTYSDQQKAARKAGLKWGAYHFANGESVGGQVSNFLNYAAPDPDELFCLDWEDNPSGSGRMSVAAAQEWIETVEDALDRPGECVIYSGNTAKELIGDDVNEFFGARRLWLCQYGSSPTWQKSWEKFWLWQFTDGISGPTPHSIEGVGPCDINSYEFDPNKLRAEWATGKAEPLPPFPDRPQTDTVSVLIYAPPGIVVKVRQLMRGAGAPPISRDDRLRSRAGETEDDIF